MERSPAEEALILLRSRLLDSHGIFSLLSNSSDSNYSKLKYIISSSITESCNNSVLLLGPRGCGKTQVLELVLKDLFAEYPDMISLIKLNGLLHSDDNCALKEIARQLCMEHQLLFSKAASFDDNSQFIISMLRECGLAHKTIVFVLDEFDLFAQGKQRLLYSLLDAMQSVTSQAVVIGISCRLDADQLLEKRVRSRFSHRKLLFCPPSKEDLERLLEHILSLPGNSCLPENYAAQFNAELHVSFRSSDLFNCPPAVEILVSYPFGLQDGQFFLTSVAVDFDSSEDSLFTSKVCHDSRFLAVSSMDLKTGLLSIENFKAAFVSLNRQPKLDYLKGLFNLGTILWSSMRAEARENKNS
ncbi:hypothetical protein Cgig2_031679 [Carnegiea gigantea]|uniref:Origin of replication complex subunit 4 n=1 Tax=Carnegiea gigantea TaxID=171969 RepID=A0A9Q1KR83_9CARY|nr:hypothetical protein Cgig2_031679 [Carnegiea gigantea]